MSFEHGTFFGGWYASVFAFGRFVGPLAGPFKTRADAESLLPQLPGLMRKYSLPAAAEPGVAFVVRSELTLGAANAELWAMPEINRDPIDVAALDNPALYAVRKPEMTKLGGGWT